MSTSSVICTPEMDNSSPQSQERGQPGWPQTAAGDTLPRSTEMPTSSNTRTNFRHNVAMQDTARAVTPEPAENEHAATTADATIPQLTRGFGTTSPQTSPRSIPGSETRRQGIVFNETYGESFDSSESSPPQQQGQQQQQQQQQQKSALRPRTHTMDGTLALRQHPTTSSLDKDNRHRVGSFSSSSSQPFSDSDIRSPPSVFESLGFPSVVPARPPDLKITVSSSSSKDKKSTNKRLIKRTARPTSPLVSPPPSVDSLPSPIPTDDANKILLLMKTLCGRMRGEVEYQNEAAGVWYSGVCWIDEDRGSLLFDSGQSGPTHFPLVGDLRGCRVLPVEHPGDGSKCLELTNHKSGLELYLRPLISDEYDLWLASLLCWQQLRPSGVRLANGKGDGSPVVGRPDTRQRGPPSITKDANIIKVGKVMLWDKGAATSPRAIVKRPSTRDLRAGSTSWRRVSCILQDNGEFKLMTENDVTILSVIDLSQLSRCAVQQLDRSVLDEEYCIAIFPIYSSASNQLSIFRPVYLALDTRVLFEVWFVLLRAFAVPDLYGLDPSTDQVVEVRDMDSEFEGQLFRVEKTIHMRVTEAKIRKATPLSDSHERHGKERDPLVGNYVAEVILDGEVRARTTTQTDTKNPFWREFTQFTELPAAMPYLSVLLKRVEGNMDSLSHQLQASLGLSKTGNLTEVLCGAVDIPLDKLERAKDHEQWLQVCNEKQESVGSMLVRVNHDELVVLPIEDYQPLSELLHRFSTGLTSQIAMDMPSSLRKLAEIFLNIFQVSGTSSDWLSALVEEEIDGYGSQNSMKKLRFGRRLKSNESSTSANDREQIVRDMGKSLAGEANLLFRGNTLLTQALEFHMRRLGKEYLEEMLCDKIFEINELNPDCEVDPSRIYRSDDLKDHWNQLTQLTSEVWQCIAISATKLPPELRQILKYVRAVAEDRYGDFLRTVNYTSVSGFLFLRFICPAILNPKLFGLLRDNPRPRAQRTLTLIAKGLQALANLSSFGKKESWMEPMNRFLMSHRQPFKDFIDQLCSISGERHVIAVPASYSTPTTILSRLTPLSREGSPSLPYLIDQARNYAALTKLWLEYHRTKNTNVYSYEGEVAEFNEICVALQTRSDECLARIEHLRHMVDTSAAAAATDDLAEAFDKTSLVDNVNMSYGSPAYLENDPYKAPGSSGSDEGPDRHADRSLFREKRFGREGSTLRQTFEGAEGFYPSGSIRSKGGPGKNPRGFLSGLIGKKGGSSASSQRDKSRDKEPPAPAPPPPPQPPKRDMLSFHESWQSDSSSRH
ncbi:GTPase activating factor [Diatrype stigma]|uniref:GTPase activating factor n=1 Tax=Diatrype stigma TaxID=117547 RepID=A0AAN9UJL3_9PEZI